MVLVAEGHEELAGAECDIAGEVEGDVGVFPFTAPLIVAVPEEVVVGVNGGHLTKFHDEAGFDGLDVEAIVDGSVATGDDAEVFLRGRAAHGDGGTEKRMKVEPSVVLGFEIEVRVMGAACRLGGVAVVVVAFIRMIA